MKLPDQPSIYEINTAAFLNRLSSNSPVTLENVPASEWDHLKSLGIDAVWMMGVWKRSLAAKSINLENARFIAGMTDVLPDFSPEDVIGSAYSISEYRVDDRFGGSEGLATARRQLADRGIGLILDYVPNHMAPDNSWLKDHPDYFLQGTPSEIAADSESFIQIGDRIFARGRDPHYPAWPDVIQVNAFSEEYRKEVITTLDSIADQCDGVRCDMAMLMMNNIFAQTWGERAGNQPENEFWSEVISAVHEHKPEMAFIAEAYWETESALIDQGFNYCYDKKLYDLLMDGDAIAIRSHLQAVKDYQNHLMRFIENHDEPRAAATLSFAEHAAASVVSSTLPGAMLKHDGQMHGYKTRIPVELARGPKEEVDQGIEGFYLHSLDGLKELSRKGEWRACEIVGDDSQLLAWTWEADEQRWAAIINFGPASVDGEVKPCWSKDSGGLLRQIVGSDSASVERNLHDPRILNAKLEAWGYWVASISA